MKKFFAKIKEDKSFIIPWFVLGLSLIIFASGLTYAYFDFALGNETQSSIKIIGTDLNVYTSAEVVELINIYPVYDEYVDQKADKFHFEVKNDSRKMIACYELNLVVTSISDALASNDFKWKLVDSDTGEVKGYGNFSGISENSSIPISINNEINFNNTDNYDLLIWLSYSDTVNQNSTMNTSFSAFIEIIAVGG